MKDEYTYNLDEILSSYIASQNHEEIGKIIEDAIKLLEQYVVCNRGVELSNQVAVSAAGVGYLGNFVKKNYANRLKDDKGITRATLYLMGE